MKNHYEKKDGYRESIKKGLIAAKTFGGNIHYDITSKEEQMKRLKKEIKNAEAIVLGAGAGLSISAGLFYSGERFKKYFFDFIQEYDIGDMYSGGFYPFPKLEIRWAWWARHIYFNRYIEAPKPVYKDLFLLLENKNYFIITTNVDHQFQKAGFIKERLFCTQGDYGLFQSLNTKLKKTYDNERWVMKAMEAQGFIKNESGVYILPENRQILMQIPTDLIPKCPDDNSDFRMNLREDDLFVEDEEWNIASDRYYSFLEEHKNKKVLYLELGVGLNTPVIIKLPFWQMAIENEKAVYACVNEKETFCPTELKNRSICIDDDIGKVLSEIIKG